MNIVDVPESTYYFQQGAIVQLVAQFIDVNTGLPIPMQVATGMSISLLYPDEVTSQTFACSLYTDGSDGCIVYTTRNDGNTIDLSQVGLYKLQANAVIGGIQLPPSYQTDFYVNPNVNSNTAPPAIFTSSAIIIFDGNGVRWAGTIQSGSLVWTAQPTGPANFLWFNQLVMKDSDGIYWNVPISTAGVPQPAVGGTFPKAIESFIITDANGLAWIVTISTSGVLTPA